MEISGKIKTILETKTFASGFRKRELVILTDEPYPQHILVEFFQEKTDILDGLKTNDYVKISINIRGREWINSEGVIKYFNYIQGWRIEKIKSKELTSSKPPKSKGSSSYPTEDDFDDLPF